MDERLSSGLDTIRFYDDLMGFLIAFNSLVAILYVYTFS